MSMRIDLSKAKLTDDEQRYVDANNYLRMAREEYLAQPEAHREAAARAFVDAEDDDEDDDTDASSAEEWVANASKPEIVAELKRRDIAHDPKSRRDDLGALLLAAVKE